jgi:DNA-binding PadR family transcriptional regulator
MVYHETARLEREGMLESIQEEGGRRRRVYALTERGHAALAQWLARPDATGMVIRDEAQLQLLFAELNGLASVRALAHAQVERYAARLRAIEETDREVDGRAFPRPRSLPIQLGRRVYRTGLEFWEEVAAWAECPDEGVDA